MQIKIPLCKCRYCKGAPHDYRQILRKSIYKKLRRKLKTHDDLDKREIPKYKGLGYTS